MSPVSTSRTRHSPWTLRPIFPSSFFNTSKYKVSVVRPMETTPSMCAARGKLEKMRWPTQRAKCTPSHTLLMTTTVAPWVVILHAHSMQTIVSIGGVTQGTLTHLHAAASLELSRTRDVAKVPAAGRV